MRLEVFSELFSMLAEVYGKRDENGMLCQTYYTLIMQSRPTAEEMFAAVSEFIDKRQERFPSAVEIKEIIWQKRNQDRSALPPAKQWAEYFTRDHRQARIDFLRGVYLHQGDTPFYRKLMAATHYMGIPLPFETVTHEDVLNSIPANKRVMEVGSAKSG